MSKFLLTGILLLLLASFMHYPTAPDATYAAKEWREVRPTIPLNEQIKLARYEQRLSQKELADKVGLSQMNLERIEKGKILPTEDVLKKFEQVLGKKFDKYRD